jgi:hypothetical protein
MKPSPLHLLRLLAVLVTEQAGDGERGLFVQALDPQAQASASSGRVALARPPPAGWFFTNTLRGRSKPDHNLDLLGLETRHDKLALRYLHVFIQ